MLLKQLFAWHHYASYVKLYNQYMESVYMLALQLTAGDRLAARNIILNAWMVAVESISGYAGKRSLRKRLVSMVVDCSRKYYQTKNQYMLIDNTYNAVQPSRLPVEKGKIASVNVEDSLGLLSVGYRHVFVLHDIYGYRLREVGQLLRISEASCTYQLFMGRKELRQLMLVEDEQQLEWSKAEMKTFKSAFCSVNIPEELKIEMLDQLNSKFKIVNNDFRISLPI